MSWYGHKNHWVETPIANRFVLSIEGVSSVRVMAHHRGGLFQKFAFKVHWFILQTMNFLLLLASIFLPKPCHLSRLCANCQGQIPKSGLIPIFSNQWKMCLLSWVCKKDFSSSSWLILCNADTVWELMVAVELRGGQDQGWGPPPFIFCAFFNKHTVKAWFCSSWCCQGTSVLYLSVLVPP